MISFSFLSLVHALQLRLDLVDKLPKERVPKLKGPAANADRVSEKVDQAPVRDAESEENTEIYKGR